jgi:integrase
VGLPLPHRRQAARNGARRIQRPGRRRPLAEARDKVGELKPLVKKGIDPIEARKREREANLAEERKQAPVNFRQATEAYFKDHAPSWRHRNSASLWLNPIVKYAYPVIGDMALDLIAGEHVVAILRAANANKAPTAGRKVQTRIGAVLNAATALGQRDAKLRNPADGKLIAAVLPSKRKAAQHFRRLALDDAPAMFRKLQALAEDSTPFAAWVFMIVTAARPSEALGARWEEEIDLDKRLWTVPGGPDGRMKAEKDHVVPLSSAAVAVLERQAKVRTGDAVFPGRSGSPYTYSAFASAPARAGFDAGSPHGWRSMFRDACGDRLTVNGRRVERDLAEAALAHALDAVEGSYRRETAIEARRPLMEAYARWLEGEGANVVAFPARA